VTTVIFVVGTVVSALVAAYVVMLGIATSDDARRRGER
jgi:phage shock protein PspC (stress-responsive transcriptional regulator)